MAISLFRSVVVFFVATVARGKTPIKSTRRIPEETSTSVRVNPSARLAIFLELMVRVLLIVFTSSVSPTRQKSFSREPGR
jgi:hypothetical protein